jgi:hypothetical protein
LKENKQVKIYIGKSYKTSYENKGYTVYEHETENTTKSFTSEQGLIKQEEKNYTKTSYYVQMNRKTFISSCKHGRICKLGYYIDPNGNEVPLIRKQTQAITVKDEKGNLYTFSSKQEAAKHFNISKTVLSNIIAKTKQGEFPLIKQNKQYNKKCISLMDCNNEILYFSSLADVSKQFNTNKMKISRIFKNKSNGDVVTINDRTYTIVEN